MKSLKTYRMARGTLIAGALFVAGLSAAARAEDPTGVYSLDAGKLAVKVTVPSVLKGTASLPNLKSLNDKTGLKGSLTFLPTSGQPGNFELGLPPLPLIGSLSIPGVWTVPAGSTKFTVELIKEEDLQQTVALLNQLLGRTDITATITKHTFAGKVLPGSQVKATFALALAIGLPPTNIVIALNGALGGTYSGPVPVAGTAPVMTNVRDFLTGFVVDEVRDLAPQQ